MIERSSPRTVLLALVGIGLIGLVAAASGLASSQFRAEFKLEYASHDTDASTGFNTLVTWSDPGAPGGAPKPIEKIVMNLPRGSRLDTRALPPCLATDEEVVSQGAAACPADTRLGTGHTDAIFESGLAFSTDVTLFNAPGQIIVLAVIHGTTTTIAEFRDQVEERRITVTPELPPGVSLTRLSLRVPEHSRQVGNRERAYLTSPPKCPAGGEWTIRARFTYVDTSTERFKSRSPCA